MICILKRVVVSGRLHRPLQAKTTLVLIMESMGSDFSNSGSVMTKSELEDVRKKRGECTTCGQKCFKKKLFKTIPIDEHGKVLNGRCLRCRPLQPKDIVGDAPMAAVSRPATRQDLERFVRSQSQLHICASTRSFNPAGNLNVPSTQRGNRSASSRSAGSFLSTNSSVSRSDNRSVGSAGSASLNRTPSAPCRTHSFAGAASSTPTGSSPAGAKSGAPGPSFLSASRVLKTAASFNGESQPFARPAPPSQLPRNGSAQSVTDGNRPKYDNGIAARSPSGLAVGATSPAQAVAAATAASVSHPLRNPPTPNELQAAAMTILAAQEHGMYQEIFEVSDLHGLQESHQASSLQKRRHSFLDPSPTHDAVPCKDRERQLSLSELNILEGPMANGCTQVTCSSTEHMASEHSLISTTSNGVSPLDGSVDRIEDFDLSELPVHGILNRGGAFILPTPGVGGMTGAQWGQRDRPVGTHYVSGSSRTLSSMSSIEEDLYPTSGTMSAGLRRGSMDDLFEEASESSISSCTATNSRLSASLVASPTNSRLGKGENGNDDLIVRNRIRNAGQAYHELICILRETSQSPDAAAEVLEELASLQFGEADHDHLADMDAPGAIADSLRAHMDHLAVQLGGCGAIWNMSGTLRNQLAFVDAGALDIIVASMDRFIDHQELQEKAIATLSNLGAAPANLEILVERGVIQRVVGAMSKHSEVSSVQIKGCGAVTNLASHDSHLKNKIMALGAGGAVVVCMVMHPDDFFLQEKALRALRNLCANCEANKVELSNIGGIDAVISAMQLHRDEAGVQEEGAWTISNLAGNDGNKAVIGECGGADVIIRAMWVHSGNVGVQEWCCRALFTLTLDLHNSTVVFSVGGITAVVSAMQGHIDSPAIQEMGCAVLANLAITDEVRMKIVDEEALDAIVFAMVLHTDDLQVQERACVALLCLATQANVASMKATNVVELARTAAMKFPEHCEDPASRLISAMDGRNF